MFSNTGIGVRKPTWRSDDLQNWLDVTSHENPLLWWINRQESVTDKTHTSVFVHRIAPQIYSRVMALLRTLHEGLLLHRIATPLFYFYQGLIGH